MKRAIYPGSFDPITYGHLDVINRASRIFSDLTVAVAQNTGKNPLFSLQERLNMLREAVGGIPNVKIVHFDTLLMNYCIKNQIHIIIRGLRAISDFEYEFQMALTNKKLCDHVETIFMMPNESYSYLSSRMIKEIVSMDGEVSAFVPPYVQKMLKKKLLRSKKQ